MKRLLVSALTFGLSATLVACSSPSTSGPVPLEQELTVVALGGGSLSDKAAAEYIENSAPLDPESVKFPANKGLDSDEAQARANALSRDYRVGEPLSEMDLEFVRAYLTPADSLSSPRQEEPTVVTAAHDRSRPDIQLALVNGQSWTFSQTQRTGAGVTAATSGSARINIGFVDHSWSAGWTAKRISGASLTKMVSTLRVQLFGAVAAPPYVGLITDWSRSETKTGIQSTYFSRNGSAVGAVAYYNMSGNTVFYTSSGSFQIGN